MIRLKEIGQGNTLEIYYERPDALEIFARGRSDRDVPLTLYL